MQAESAVETAIYNLGETVFGKIVNPIVALFVIFAIGYFLYAIAMSLLVRFRGGKPDFKNDLLWPVIGLTIMLTATGITYFLGYTGDELFGGGRRGEAVRGIGDVVQPLNIDNR